MSQRERRILMLVVTVVVLGLAALGYTAYARHAQAVEEAEVYSRLQVYCAEYHARNGLQVGRCTWTGDMQSGIPRECHRQNPVLEDAFRQCLNREGIRPL